MLMLGVLMVLPALAYFEFPYEGQTLGYTITDAQSKEVEVSSGQKISGDLIIPSVVTYNDEEYTVKKIGSSAFNDCNSLNSVIISDSVISIGDRAFYNCTGLTSLSIGNSVESIGLYAFLNCTGLTSVILPNHVESVAYNAFASCEGLIKCAYPSILTSNPFYIGPTSVEYPAEGAEFEEGYIWGPNKSAIYFAPITLEGEYEIPASVSSIGEYAFSRCEGLTSVIIGNSVKSIDYLAFYKCTGLTSLSIGDSVETIGLSAFSNCTSLTSVILPNHVESVGYQAFENCTGLIKSAYPSSLASNPFSNGTSVQYPAEEAEIEDGYVWGPNKSAIYFAPITLEGEYEIPASVSSIGEYAFSRCEGLTSLTIGDSVETIGIGAFDGCTLITVKSLSPKPASITYDSFSGQYDTAELVIDDAYVPDYLLTPWSNFKNIRMSNSETPVLTYSDGVLNYRLIPASSTDENNKAIVINGNYTGEITVPERFTYTNEQGENTRYYIDAIGYEAFAESSISKIDFNSRIQLKAIGQKAFYQCKELSSIDIPNTVTTIDEQAFDSCDGLNSINIGEAVSSIAKGAFEGCSSLSEVVIPNSVSTIGDYAFAYDNGLSSITIGEAVSSIGKGAFEGCSSLSEVVIPNSVSTIGDSAFAYDKGLSSITIGEKVSSIGESAFEGCSSLSEVVIPNSVSTISAKTFRNNSNLSKITFGENVSAIGESAFEGCSSLPEVVIPNSVLTIGARAFMHDSALASIQIGENVSSIGESAFIWCFNLNQAEFASLESLCSIDFSNALANPLAYSHNLYVNGEKITNLIIPESISSIGNYAFYGCSNLKSISLSTNSIGTGAFSGCSGVSVITLGNGVEAIEAPVFNDCTALTDLTIEDGTTPIYLSGSWISRVKKLYMGREIEIK